MIPQTVVVEDWLVLKSWIVLCTLRQFVTCMKLAFVLYVYTNTHTWKVSYILNMI